MAKRSKRKQETIETSAGIVGLPTAEATIPIEKNPAAVLLGRLGGLKGGKARAAKLSRARRVEIAKNASLKRWGKTKL